MLAIPTFRRKDAAGDTIHRGNVRDSEISPAAVMTTGSAFPPIEVSAGIADPRWSGWWRLGAPQFTQAAKCAASCRRAAENLPAHLAVRLLATRVPAPAARRGAPARAA